VDLAAALTDIFLATVALLGSFRAIQAGRGFGGMGLGIVGVAACLGTLRFFGVEALVPFHDAASWIAGTTGVPLIGLAILQPPDRVQLPLGLAFLIGSSLTMGIDIYRTAVAGSVMIACIGYSVWRRDAYSGAGALMVLLSGLILPPICAAVGIGKEGPFHIAFAAALLLLTLSLVNQRKASRPT
jgi:hypothetical protein